MNKLILNDIQDLWRWREKINIDDLKEDPMAEDMPLYFPCAVVWHEKHNDCICYGLMLISLIFLLHKKTNNFNNVSKLLFFDLETTGVKFWRNGIHQIGGIVDIDGQEVERFDIRLAPNPAATIEQEALDVAGVTLEQVQSYQPMEEGYRQLVGILSKYVNKFDKRDKMYLVGYNNAGFDNNFLRALFTQCGDKYFGSWFYPNCMDVYVMVTPFLMGVRNDMENF